MAELRLRIVMAGAMVGPGKAQLLEGIAATGSIAAAGRAMGMSYKRAWLLVEEMNAAFRAPLVASLRGGAGGGGARLTPEGEQVLALWTRIADAAQAAAAPAMAEMEALLRPPPGDVPDQK